MRKVDLLKCLAALAALSGAFEKYPHGAMLVGGLVALGMICYTIINVQNKREQ
jgi:hypothetical protein